MSNLPTPSLVTDNAIGFNPSKQILTVVYRALLGPSYIRTVANLSELGEFDLPLRVVIGREEGSSDDKDRMRRIGLPTNQQERKARFNNIGETIQINSAVRLGFSCSSEQCFISIFDNKYRLNHLSMPLVPNEQQTIHFKEDIAENNGSKYYYEYVPWNNLSSISRASLQEPKLREKIREVAPASKPTPKVEDAVLKLGRKHVSSGNQLTLEEAQQEQAQRGEPMGAHGGPTTSTVALQENQQTQQQAAPTAAPKFTEAKNEEGKLLKDKGRQLYIKSNDNANFYIKVGSSYAKGPPRPKKPTSGGKRRSTRRRRALRKTRRV